MKYQQEIHNITDIKYFENYIKKEAINTFLVIFANSKLFTDVFEMDILTDKIVSFECRKFIFESPEKENSLLIYQDDIEKIIKSVYKELVELVLNKLVDIGVIELYWDNKKCKVFWKRIKGINASKKIQKYKSSIKNI